MSDGTDLIGTSLNTFQTITPYVDNLLKLKIKEWRDKRYLEKDMEKPIYDNFEEYLKRAYVYYSSVNFIALGNNQIRIDDIYQPLTLQDFSDIDGAEEYLISDYNIELAEKYKKILITGTAGMGKSTLIKKMFLSVINQNIGVPILIELKKLEYMSILDLICEDLTPIHVPLNKELVLNLINKGAFIIFLDGYDEIPYEVQQRVTEDLKVFLKKAYKNTFFLTSREDSSLSSFGDFKHLHIKSLSLKESYSVINKIDKITNHNISEKLISNIKDNSKKSVGFDDLNNFLGVPLLITLIYISFKLKRDLSLKKDEFYEKVVNALYEEHDLSKDHFKRSQLNDLSRTEYFKILSSFAYVCFKKDKIEYKESELINVFQEVIDNIYGEYGLVKPEELIKDTLKNIPLLLKDGVNIKWSHKSFMEYFAGCYIRNNKYKANIIENIYKSTRIEKYINFLDLYYDIDSETFEEVIVLQILDDFFDSHFNKEIYWTDGKMYLRSLVFNYSIYLEEIAKEDEDPSPIGDFERVEILCMEYNVNNCLTNEETQHIYIKTEEEKLTTIGASILNRNYYNIFRILYNKKSELIELYDQSADKPEGQSEFENQFLNRNTLDSLDYNTIISNFEKATKIGTGKNKRIIDNLILMYIDPVRAKSNFERIKNNIEREKNQYDGW